MSVQPSCLPELFPNRRSGKVRERNEGLHSKKGKGKGKGKPIVFLFLFVIRTQAWHAGGRRGQMVMVGKKGRHKRGVWGVCHHVCQNACLYMAFCGR